MEPQIQFPPYWQASSEMTAETSRSRTRSNYHGVSQLGAHVPPMRVSTDVEKCSD